MKLNDKPKHKIKMNLGAVIVCCILCLGGGFLIGNQKNKASITASQGTNKVQEVYDILKNKWLNTGDAIDLDETLAKAMMEAVGDPYNSYFTQSELTDFQDSINKNYEGIGVAFNTHAGLPIITKVYEGSPAKKAGLQEGDILQAVDHQSIQDKSSDEIIGMVRGESGSDVVLTILRKQETFDVTITRAKVDYSALYEIKTANNHQYGLITLSSFGTTTASEVQKALDYFTQENIDTLVFDVRGNPGGYLQAAKGILDLLLEKGQVELITENKQGKQVEYISSNEQPYRFSHGYVLINNSSASASEVLTGALQEVLRYTVIGEQSYGKGVAQDQATLSDLSVVKYTYAKWLLPSGKWIGGEGITPDIEVKNISLEGLYDFELDSSLQQDSVDERIAQFQKMLKLIGYDCGREDGYFSENTKTVLQQFEKDHQLTENGTFDQEDENALISAVIEYAYASQNDEQYKKLESLIQ